MFTGVKHKDFYTVVNKVNEKKDSFKTPEWSL